MGWLLLLIRILCLQFLVFVFPSYSSSFKPLCNPDHSSALLQLKSSFTIYCTSDFVNCHRPSQTTSWENGTDCCSWEGVTCDTMSGHVIELDLTCGCLHGQIRPNSTLFQLTHLRELRLRFNNISGQLPSSLSNLQQLTFLDVSWNNFSGQLPDVFGKVSKLTFLDLTMNKFEGQLPSSLFDLTQISELSSSYNKFTGPLPKKITGFSQLTELTLAHNLINGTIPSWCLSLPSLRVLWLTNNQFTGQIGTISSPSLAVLYLSRNKLHGSIPESILNLEYLDILSLSSNNLSGHVNFHLFSKFKYLSFLSLSKNSLSLNFENINNSSFSTLAYLGLSSTNITSFPKFLSQLPSLEYLDLSCNRVQGEVPKWLHEIGKYSLKSLNLSQNLLTSMGQFSWKNLEHLDLRSNLLSGDISSSICNASHLKIVNLSQNKLTGIIPQCLSNLSSLTVLDLQQNQLYGILPGSFSKQNTLTSLNLNSNHLEGPLPRTLAYCTKLNLLDVGNNQIKDTFPHWLQTLPELRVLVLRANKFHGVITDTETEHPFPKLRVFDVSNNNFSGPVPAAYIRNFKAITNAVEGESSLQYMNIDFLSTTVEDSLVSYEYSMLVTIKGIDMVLEKIITSLAIIDLSKNKFQGEIPEVIGQLQQLKWLNLSHNKLTGPIPQSIGNLDNLESLDLSSNMLSGGIPIELINLNFLSVLNFSQNHLVGKIPQGKQFDTFSNDSYEGNLGLCGPPLSRKCNKDPEGQSPSSLSSHQEEKFGFGWKPVALGYGCGVVFGVVLGYSVFSTGKPQWLVRIFEGEPNRRARRTRMRPRANHARMD